MTPSSLRLQLVQDSSPHDSPVLKFAAVPGNLLRAPIELCEPGLIPVGVVASLDAVNQLRSQREAILCRKSERISEKPRGWMLTHARESTPFPAPRPCPRTAQRGVAAGKARAAAFAHVGGTEALLPGKLGARGRRGRGAALSTRLDLRETDAKAEGPE